MNNSSNGLNSRLNPTAEERVSKHEARLVKCIETEKLKEHSRPTGQHKNNFNVRVIGDHWNDRRKNNTEKLFEEIMAEKFVKIVKCMNLYIQQAQ